MQEQVAFEKEHLPHENEGWAMKALEGAVHMSLRYQAVKYQAYMMHLEILQDPPAVRCNRDFEAGGLVMHLLPQPRGPPTSRCSAALTRIPRRIQPWRRRPPEISPARCVDSTGGAAVFQPRRQR